MNVLDEHTRSLWMDVRVAEAPSLSRSERADVVVVGSGMPGCRWPMSLLAEGAP
jgi:hypothetical protein